MPLTLPGSALAWINAANLRLVGHRLHPGAVAGRRAGAHAADGEEPPALVGVGAQLRRRAPARDLVEGQPGGAGELPGREVPAPLPDLVEQDRVGRTLDEV